MGWNKSFFTRRWMLMLRINGAGYFNLGFDLFVRNGGFSLHVKLLLGSVTVMYVAPRSPAWMKNRMQAAQKEPTK